MKKLTTWFLSIFFVLLANAQEATQTFKKLSIDSLKNGFISHQKNNPQLAKAYLLALLEKATSSNNTLKAHKIHYQLANSYKTLRNKDSALYHIDNAIKKAGTNQTSLSNYIYLKGGIHYEFGDYLKAIEYYTDVYEIANKNNNFVTKANIANDIALIKTQIGQNLDALQLVKKNLPFYEALVQQKDGEKYSISYINSLMSISDIYTNLYIDQQKSQKKYLDSAQYYNNIAITKSLQYNDDLGFAISLRLKGIIHHEEGNIEQSTTDLIKATELFQNLNNPKRLLLIYLYRGKNYFTQKNYEKALEYFQKTEALLQETEADFPDLQELYILMAKSYEQKNDSKNAIQYFNLFYQKDVQNDDLTQQSL